MNIKKVYGFIDNESEAAMSYSVKIKPIPQPIKIAAMQSGRNERPGM